MVALFVTTILAGKSTSSSDRRASASSRRGPSRRKRQHGPRLLGESSVLTYAVIESEVPNENSGL